MTIVRVIATCLYRTDIKEAAGFKGPGGHSVGVTGVEGGYVMTEEGGYVTGVEGGGVRIECNVSGDPGSILPPLW